MKSYEQFSRARKVNLGVSETQLDAGTFIRHPTIEDKKKYLGSEDLVSVCLKEKSALLFSRQRVVWWSPSFDTITLG